MEYEKALNPTEKPKYYEDENDWLTPIIDWAEMMKQNWTNIPLDHSNINIEPRVKGFDVKGLYLNWQKPSNNPDKPNLTVSFGIKK